MCKRNYLRNIFFKNCMRMWFALNRQTGMEPLPFKRRYGQQAKRLRAICISLIYDRAKYLRAKQQAVHMALIHSDSLLLVTSYFFILKQGISYTFHPLHHPGKRSPGSPPRYARLWRIPPGFPQCPLHDTFPAAVL